MAVAWIGNREAPMERAVAEAATLLSSSRCPVFSFDTDIDGTRAAIALAERVGAAFDHVDGDALARETAMITDKGGMFIAPGEVRRRADVIAIVGELPKAHHALVAEIAGTAPDLSTNKPRSFFLIGDEGTRAPPLGGKRATRLSCGGLAATLAALRAQCGGRRVTRAVFNFDRFAEALASASFPVFLFSGYAMDGLAMEMLEGVVADLNRAGRASALHLPASESGWGSTLAATWMTGFALRTGFGRGLPEFDPWRFDAARMIAAGETDLRFLIGGRSSSSTRPPDQTASALIALSKTQRPIPGAAVTIAIGAPGIDHDAVVYSARTGSLVAMRARQASDLPSAATILRAVAERIPAGVPLPC